jgi:hypothetical protein
MSSTIHERAASADRPISETFLDFAAPLFRVMPNDASDKEIDTVLKIAFTVWNSVVFDDVNGDDHRATEIRQLISRSPGSGVLVNTLIARKRVLFVADRRLIGEYIVTFEQSRPTLWAEARVPQSRP